jgi:hypothetical protein
LWANGPEDGDWAPFDRDGDVFTGLRAAKHTSRVVPQIT